VRIPPSPLSSRSGLLVSSTWLAARFCQDTGGQEFRPSLGGRLDGAAPLTCGNGSAGRSVPILALRGTPNRDGTFSRVRRGGAWTDNGWPRRSASRLRFEPERRSDHIGFRVIAVRP